MVRRASFVFLALVVACGGSSDDGGGAAGSGGAGGMGGAGGNGGQGGTGGSAGDGGQGGGGGSELACVDSVCSCNETGIRDAIAEGGGPFTFDCDDPTTVETEAEIVIDNDVILDGEGNLTVDGRGTHRVFSVAETVAAELRGFTVTNGSVGVYYQGGGILNLGTLTLTDSTVSWNIAGAGGGIFNIGTLTVNNSGVSNNTALNGGGIENHGGATLTLTNSTVSENIAGLGGGIQNDGTLTLSGSTVAVNTARHGGGIFSIGTLTLSNSTVSRNSADSGGGIENQGGGTLTLTNSTVSENTASEGGGIDNTYGGDLTARGTLINNDCFGATALTGGYNIESPGDTCGFDQGTDLFGVTAAELNLGPLQDNGGPTETHKPGDGGFGSGSVAIDWIPEASCGAATDQRGQPRPETGGAQCDVGSVEVQP